MPTAVPPSPARSLADLDRGEVATVVGAGREHRTRLAMQGIRPGVVVAVEQDAPFGGPRVVRVGAVRVAIARGVARSVLVQAVDRPHSVEP